MELLKAKRHELKYTISDLNCLVLKNRLSKVLKKDKNCPEEGYSIASVYFDDYNNKAYTEKINGNDIRHKYRIRFYNDDTSFLKLERKSKIHQMTMKSSVSLTESEVKDIYAGNFEFLKEKKENLYKDFYFQLAHCLIKPKVIVKYNRVAFIHPVGDLRITFDTNVKTSINQVNIFEEKISYIPALGINENILEIKFNGVMPDYIKSLIESGNVMASSSSKYVYSRKYNYNF
ncbi:polyphosphate polymerase domain-containing protein [Clostridium sp.]|uniref:polyphosphate polymerase domain-containing protein n=1 Tax=Clostridium sp. TaxID=1506 RepID=UPI001A478752|nr:polyphosphate polymerase domain-containing protein [Clostridium sp.]MBK5241470.1 polyphosphate polymerase domain-containing protein [Clostridium sp.]